MKSFDVNLNKKETKLSYKDIYMSTKFNIYLQSKNLDLKFFCEETSLHQLIEQHYFCLRKEQTIRTNSPIGELLDVLEDKYDKKIILEKYGCFIRAVSIIRPEFKFKIPECFLS